MENIKNDLKNSIEKLTERIRDIDREMAQGLDGDWLPNRKRELERLRIHDEALLALLERMDRLEEKINMFLVEKEPSTANYSPFVEFDSSETGGEEHKRAMQRTMKEWMANPHEDEEDSGQGMLSMKQIDALLAAIRDRS